MFILQQNKKMVITKGEDVTKQGFCKLPTLKKTPSSGKSLYISTYSVNLIVTQVGGVGVSAYSRLGAY